MGKGATGNNIKLVPCDSVVMVMAVSLSTVDHCVLCGVAGCAGGGVVAGGR